MRSRIFGTVFFGIFFLAMPFELLWAQGDIDNTDDTTSYVLNEDAEDRDNSGDDAEQDEDLPEESEEESEKDNSYDEDEAEDKPNDEQESDSKDEAEETGQDRAPDEAASGDEIEQEASDTGLVDEADRSREDTGDESAATEEDSLKTITSIDTVSLSEPSGNWFFKRHWYQKAQSKYGEIGGIISKIFQQRALFMKIDNQVDTELLDPFYQQVGIDIGEMTQAVAMLLAQLDDLRRHEGGLDEEQEELLESLSNSQDTLESLREDVGSIAQLDKAFNQSIQLMVDQIDSAVAYQKQAYTAVEAISQELNDLQAKAEYLKVRSLFRSVQDIYRYLAGDLFAYINRLAQNVQAQTARVTNAIKELQAIDIDVIEEARALRTEACLIDEDPTVQDEVSEEELDEADNLSSFNPITAISNAIKWPMRAIASLFGSSAEVGDSVMETEVADEE